MTSYRNNPDGLEEALEITSYNQRTVNVAARMQFKAEQEAEIARRLEAQRKARKRQYRRPE